LAKGVARGSVLGMLGQGWHLVTAFVLYEYLARRLGPQLFGDWRVVLSLLAWFEVFVTSAIVKVATKEISETPDDTPRLGRAAYIGQMLVAGVVFLAVQVAAGPMAVALGDASLAPLIRISALDIPLYGLLTVASAIVLGRQRYARQGVAWIVYATAKAALIAGLVAAGFGVQGALVGNAASSLVGFAALVGPLGRRARWTSGLLETARGMLLVSIPFVAVSLVEWVAQNADLWLVSGLARPGALVGFYASATILAEVPVFLFLGLNRVIFPSVASARAAGEKSLADAYTTQAMRAALLVTVLALGFVAARGRQVIDLVYSSAYAAAYVPLVLLMAAALGRTVQATCTEVLMAENRRTTALTILVGSVVIEVALVAVLIPRFGLTGAASGAAIGGLAAAIACGVALRDAVGWRPLATLARALVAAALVSWPLALLAPRPLWLPVALVGSVVAYLALLWVAREFSPDEVAAMRSMVAGLGRSRG
jgi:O-antigen/teichoic acid export membrane protein